MDEKRALAQRVRARQLAIDHFEIVDPVQGRMPGDRVTPELVAAAEGHVLPPSARWKVCTCSRSLRRMLYCTVMDSTASSASTRTPCTTISSPSHCCKAPWISICVALPS